MILRKILMELRGIRKELQAIFNNLESSNKVVNISFGNNQNDQLKKMIDCPSCGKKVLETANFCKYCNAKIKDTCSYCWVKKEDNYNCGESNCPGYGLFRLEKLKSQ